MAYMGPTVRMYYELICMHLTWLVYLSQDSSVIRSNLFVSLAANSF